MAGGVCKLVGPPRWVSGERSTCQCRRCRFDPWVEKISWRRAWQPTPVFLPGKLLRGIFRGKRSEEPGRLQFRMSQRVRHNWALYKLVPTQWEQCVKLYQNSEHPRSLTWQVCFREFILQIVLVLKIGIFGIGLFITALFGIAESRTT